jgi:hypothetical protein
MLSFNEKIELLKNYLEDIKDNYADSFKTDILIYFDEFEDIDESDSRLKFLNRLNSKEEIHRWVDNLTSKIVLKFDEDDIGLSDFIFYES